MTPYQLFCKIKDEYCDGESELDWLRDTEIIDIDKQIVVSVTGEETLFVNVCFGIDTNRTCYGKIYLRTSVYIKPFIGLTDILSSDRIPLSLRRMILFNLDCFE